MDGAGKFVRGDAIAALIIVGINVSSPASASVSSRKHMDTPWGRAGTFTLLSVGNALATTVPAFLLSTAMGSHRHARVIGESLGEDLLRQAIAHPAALRTVGASMLALALVPGLPHVAFGVLGVLGLVGGRCAERADQRVGRAAASERQRKRRRVRAQTRRRGDARWASSSSVSTSAKRCLPLLDEPAGTALLQRIGGLRRALALELGIVLPGRPRPDDLRPARQRVSPSGTGSGVVARDHSIRPRAVALGTPARFRAAR